MKDLIFDMDAIRKEMEKRGIKPTDTSNVIVLDDYRKQKDHWTGTEPMQETWHG